MTRRIIALVLATVVRVVARTRPARRQIATATAAAIVAAVVILLALAAIADAYGRPGAAMAIGLAAVFVSQALHALLRHQPRERR